MKSCLMRDRSSRNSNILFAITVVCVMGLGIGGRAAAQLTRVEIVARESKVDDVTGGFSGYEDVLDAARNMAFDFVGDEDRKPHEIHFMEGLQQVFEGRLESASVVFAELAASSLEPEYRDAELEVLVILYESLGKNDELLALIEADPSLVENKIVETPLEWLELSRTDALTLMLRETELPF